MDNSPDHRSFLLPHATPMWYEYQRRWMEGRLYIPRLEYAEIDGQLVVLRFLQIEGKRLPEEVQDCLRRLAGAVGHVQLSDDQNDERIGLENALSILRDTQQAFEKHGLPEQELLTQIQIVFTRVRNELAEPGPSPGSGSPPSPRHG